MNFKTAFSDYAFKKKKKKELPFCLWYFHTKNYIQSENTQILKSYTLPSMHLGFC